MDEPGSEPSSLKSPLKHKRLAMLQARPWLCFLFSNSYADHRIVEGASGHLRNCHIQGGAVLSAEQFRSQLYILVLEQRMPMLTEGWCLLTGGEGRRRHRHRHGRQRRRARRHARALRGRQGQDGRRHARRRGGRGNPAKFQCVFCPVSNILADAAAEVTML